MEFLKYLVIAMLCIQGINCLFSEGHLLEKVGNWVYENLPEWIYKPTIGCPMCMSSTIGTITYITCISPNIDSWIHKIVIWPVFCIALCGANYLFYKMTNPNVTIDEDL